MRALYYQAHAHQLDWPRHKRARNAKSDSAVTIFVRTLYRIFFKGGQNWTTQKFIATADLDFPRQEFSVRDLGISVALLVCCQMNV